MKNKKIKALFLATSLFATPLMAATQGVSDDEVKIGGALDLSGIFAPFSVPAAAAANAYFDEVNANGGVHGRKINYIVEDHGYQVPRAAQAANKLINRDQVFAMLLNMGTPQNLAMFKLMGPKGIPNLSPITNARQMVEPPEPWKFAAASSYYEAVTAGMNYLVENEGTKRVCLMILPTDFGSEIEARVQEMADAGSIELGVKIGHKPDESDFTGALGKVKSAGCDTVGLALGVSQTINAISTARKLGMDDLKFYVSAAGFHTVLAKGLMQQGVTGGVFAGAGTQDLEARVNEPAVAEWMEQYKKATGEDFPGTGAILGRSAAELLYRALEAAGPDLTHESFIAAMESLDYDDEISGNHVDFSTTDHVGADEVFISRIDNGSWVLVDTIR
ncbi:ABC transporter substrate-binding protein [Marinobacterium mangrovicola]|uniref:Amino acid/amide ABC transporter substrate-binding protein (HAAT family) n=1 Tax=Marinobacterium mangrovicola TaxID=1476959 RepID=A0A4R1GET4_9GAMM|nr:ABC transporter substrate-binding protein [Marinobacterium mangrovicola]TCK04309.1 amino acid/amide ABC transporter substrate-binding protein (HAAT family) [Marinobacterium mangrovicola]